MVVVLIVDFSVAPTVVPIVVVSAVVSSKRLVVVGIGGDGLPVGRLDIVVAIGSVDIFSVEVKTSVFVTTGKLVGTDVVVLVSICNIKEEY